MNLSNQPPQPGQQLELLPSERSVTAKESLTQSVAALAAQLSLSQENSKADVSAALYAEFVREFQREPPEAILHAFRAHRIASSFFPSIGEIAARVEEWHVARYLQRETNRRNREREEREIARREGRLLEWPDIYRMFQEAAANAPEAHRVEQNAFKFPTTLIEEWSPGELAERKHAAKQQIQQYLAIKAMGEAAELTVRKGVEVTEPIRRERQA